MSSKGIRSILGFFSERVKIVLISIVILLMIIVLSGTLFAIVNRAPFMISAGGRGVSFIYPYTITFQTSAEALALFIALILVILGYYALTEGSSKVLDSRLANIIYVSGLVLFMLGVIIVLMVLNIKIGRIF